MGVLAIGLAAAVPARADFAVVTFPDKTCQAWAEHRAVPAGAGWKYLWGQRSDMGSGSGKGCLCNEASLVPRLVEVSA